MIDPESSLVARMQLRSVVYIILLLCLFGFLTTSAPVAAVETVSGSGNGGMLTALLITVLAAVVVAILIITGLVFWGRKLEHIEEMMLFCMKYLINSQDEAERCASAKALGRSNDYGALLVLIDVALDEEESEAVRKAASETLHEMSVHYPKYIKIVADFEFEAELGNIPGIIEILTTNFEQGETKYAQSAYIIGRHYMRLGCYVDARTWLTKAEFRNRKFDLYGNRIRYWVQVCNTRLLKEADDAFKAADYQRAKELYAFLDHGLSDADMQRCAVYLRSACVYCKLKDYQNADQSLLQALHHNHETDLALTLASSLREILSQGDKNVEPNDKLEKIVSEIMNALWAQKY